MEVKIEGINDQGKGVCFIDNKVTFVDKTTIGDIIKIKLIEKHSKYNIGKVVKYIEKSDKRVDSYCPYQEECGGCDIPYLSYNDTLEYKKDKVRRNLKKLAKIEKDIDIIPSPKHLNYRNKITLHISNGVIGYYKERSYEVINILECKIANDEINKFIPYIKVFGIKNGEVVIRCNYNNELLINFITKDPIIIPVIKDLKIAGILKNGTILQGDSKFMELVNNKFFQVSYDSFFQVNRDICSKLFDLVKENILPNSNVVDLYCGVGTLGINVSDIVNKVYGIEIIPNAIMNAVVNAKINKCNNEEFMLGDATKVLPKINDKIDVVICDPPRQGLDKGVIDTIKSLDVKQIIYISCDPITLSRDINFLSDKYELNKIVALDMFPFTYHVESVTLLSLK